MSRRLLGRALPAALAALLLASAALAQVGGGFDLSWNTVDGGGATFSTGGPFRLGGTSGQPDAGTHTGGPYTLRGGFWGVARAIGTATSTPTGTAATGTPTATPTGTPPIPGLPPGLVATATRTATPTTTPTPTPTLGVVDPNPDKDEQLTEEEERQRERTNTGSEEDERVEGDVLAVFCERKPPQIEIGNRDGRVTLRLLREAAPRCGQARPGQYLTSDNTEKQHELLYDLFDFAVRQVENRRLSGRQTTGAANRPVPSCRIVAASAADGLPWV